MDGRIRTRVGIRLNDVTSNLDTVTGKINQMTIQVSQSAVARCRVVSRVQQFASARSYARNYRIG